MMLNQHFPNNMTDNNLYQQVIIDHNHNPRNAQKLTNFSHSAKADNPLCGDKLELFLLVEDDVLTDIGFEGSGCAISQAAASLMTEIVKGKKIEEVRKLIIDFDRLVKNELSEEEITRSLGKLSVFSGIWQYPARVKCASLAWQSLDKALNK